MTPTYVDSCFGVVGAVPSARRAMALLRRGSAFRAIQPLGVSPGFLLS